MNVTGHIYKRQGKRGGVWYAKYRPANGRQVKQRLGPAHEGKGRPPVGHFTKRTAQDALDAVLTDLRRGTVQAPTERAGVIFAQAVESWLDWVQHDRKRKPSTLVGYRSTVTHHLVPELGELELESITRERIETYRRRLVSEDKLSPRSINKLLIVLGSIFRHAMETYGLPTNPAAGVHRQPDKRSGDIDVLSPPEVELLAAGADNDQDAALYRVAAFTGLRLGELRALRWSDIDFSMRIVHVRRSYTAKALGTPKSGRVRSVPLIDQAAKALDGLSRREHWTDEDDLVFASESGSFIDESALRRRMRAALKRAGLKPMTFHSLRHTFGTIAVQAFPLTDVQAFMGHANIQTTMVYVHHVPQDDAADKLGRVVESASDPLGKLGSRELGPELGPELRRSQPNSADLKPL